MERMDERNRDPEREEWKEEEKGILVFLIIGEGIGRSEIKVGMCVVFLFKY